MVICLNPSIGKPEHNLTKKANWNKKLFIYAPSSGGMTTKNLFIGSTSITIEAKKMTETFVVHERSLYQKIVPSF